MATSPLGNFADLSGYRRNLDMQRAAQLNADPLAELIQSVQQGYALQQLPQTMMAQRQQQQEAALATQLKNALVAEQLNVLRNPQAARDAKLQEDVIRGLVSGTNQGLVLEQPVSPELIEMRRVAEAAGGAPSPVSDFIPLATLPGGQRAGLSPSAAADSAARKNAARIAEIQARADAAGVSGSTIIDAAGNPQFIPNKMVGGVAPTASQVMGADGKPIKGQLKAATTKGTLTEAQKLKERVEAARVGVQVDDFKDPNTGDIDWARVATARGEAEGKKVDALNIIRQARADAAASKAGRPTEGQANFQLYGNRMDQADTVLLEVMKNGFDPTSIGTDGLVGSFLPNILKSSERQQFEQAQRNFINAALRKESGAVISDGEFKNARAQYFPQTGDSEELLAQKSANRKLIIDEFQRLGGQETPASQPKPNASTPPIRVTTRQAYDALPPGTAYIDSKGVSGTKR